ncbi:HlyD family secretion protein [Chondrinema litorale]|uniref:HlyD family secretion protein n=1 Tax=Chondrinema litorale TaxID=2994555 RepID=UPI002543B914|nr:HlyD family efflux transporter periplasmic adaptor subunit [Chondrinema litorale]UZR93714.1 HlyD family efflux transporter periplasmic adaptor subunit [Chondrinema litorale]
MKNTKVISIKAICYLPIILFLASCGNDDNAADAYGQFEATEVIVSAEGSGKIISLDVEEGSEIKVGEVVGCIDTVQLFLKKQQLQATIAAVTSKTQNISDQLAVYYERKENLVREKNRLESLFKEDAATDKQLDDINGEIEVVEKQLDAVKSQLSTQNSGILGEILPLEKQIAQIEDQLQKSVLRHPVSGIVLEKYAEEGEVASFGKPLYKIAVKNDMYLRVYLSAKQLAKLKLQQPITVRIDTDEENYLETTGTLAWISNKAEFTPKNIQTKEDRVNMVYAAKIRVKDDGTFKIGMPGEAIFNNDSSNIAQK